VYAGSYNRLLDARINVFALKFAEFKGFIVVTCMKDENVKV